MNDTPQTTKVATPMVIQTSVGWIIWQRDWRQKRDQCREEHNLDEYCGEAAWLQEQELFEAEDQIRALLHNVLPPSIAPRKLAGESPVADRFADASVLFADVVDFTSLSARLESSQVVNMLNDLFSRFDRISARHGLEKIKTIGDCYMAAAGIPEAASGHLAKAAKAAFEMLNEVSDTRAPDAHRWGNWQNKIHF